MCGFWSAHDLNYACGRVESGGVEQCTGHVYLHVLS